MGPAVTWSVMQTFQPAAPRALAVSLESSTSVAVSAQPPSSLCPSTTSLAQGT